MAQAFAATHGVEVADIIMEHLPPEGWSELATKTDVATQGQLLRSEFDLKMSDLKGELTQKMSDLREEISKGFRNQRQWIIGTAFGFLALLAGVISATAAIIR